MGEIMREQFGELAASFDLRDGVEFVIRPQIVKCSEELTIDQNKFVYGIFSPIFGPDGTKRIIVGLNLLDRGIIRENYKIYKDGNEIGYVTSGGFSPTLEKTIGLGLVKVEHSKVDTDIQIEIRNKMLKGKIVPTPFFRNV